MARVDLHPDALAEWVEAVAFYEGHAPSVGRDFFLEVRRVLLVVAENPALGAEFDPPYRRYICQRFPFGVVYRLVDGSVRVLAVMHLRRRPGYWKERS